MAGRHLLVSATGWLLTPVVALAAGFAGAAVGTALAALLPNPMHGVALTVLTGGLAGYLSVHYWLRALRRSPDLQHALHVLPDGTPEAAAEESDPPSSPGAS